MSLTNDNNFGLPRRNLKLSNLQLRMNNKLALDKEQEIKSEILNEPKLETNKLSLQDAKMVSFRDLSNSVYLKNFNIELSQTTLKSTDNNLTFTEEELQQCLDDDDLINELFTKKRCGILTFYEIKSDDLKNFDKQSLQRILRTFKNFDKETVKTMLSTANEYVNSQSDLSSTRESKAHWAEQCIYMQEKLYNSAKTKDVDATEYVQLRLPDFMAMYSDTRRYMSIDEMNETLALNNVYSTLIDSAEEVYSKAFGTSPNNLSELLNLAVSSLSFCDENPNFRSAYLSTQNAVYLSLAKKGKLTNKEFYENLKQDLINIFPNVDSLNDEDYQNLIKKVNTLSPEEVQNFIRQALTVPSNGDKNYQSKLDDFMNSFDNLVATKQGAYIIKNPDDKADLNSVYKLVSGVDFNADSIIKEKAKLSSVNDLIEASTNQMVIENLLSSVESGEVTLNDALWQIAYLYTGSTDDNDISKFIKEMIGQDVSVKNGEVSFGQQNYSKNGQVARVMSNNDNSILNNVKDWCSSNFQNVVDRYVSDSMKNDASNADFSSAKGCVEYALSLLSDPSFYDSFGNMCLDASLATLVVGGSITAGSAATGAGIPIAAGTGISTSAIAGCLAMLGGISKAIGGTLEYVQNLIKGNDINSSTTSFLTKMAEAGLDYLGGKYIDAVVELPSAVKSVWNKIVSNTNSTMNKLMDNATRVANSENLSSSKVLDALTSEESSWLNSVKDVANTGKYYNKETGQTINISNGGRSAINQAVKELEKGIDPTLRKALQNRKNDVQLVQKYINSSDEEILNALKKEINETYQPSSVEQLQKEFIENNPDLDEDMMEELLQEIVDNYSDDSIDRLLREIYSATGKDLTGASKEELIDALAQHKLDFINKNKGYIQYLENFLSSQKLSSSVDVVRVEYQEVAKSINIEGKSLDQWLQEANQTGDYTELLEKLNSGNLSYKYERVAGTSIADAGYNGVFKWNIKAPAGTEGFFTDALYNTYGLSEWELLLNKGTTLNINSAYVQDGQLFINATVEVVGQNGKTHMKEIFIGMGVVAGLIDADANKPQGGAGGGAKGDRDNCSGSGITNKGGSIHEFGNKVEPEDPTSSLKPPSKPEKEEDDPFKDNTLDADKNDFDKKDEEQKPDKQKGDKNPDDNTGNPNNNGDSGDVGGTQGSGNNGDYGDSGSSVGGGNTGHKGNTNGTNGSGNQGDSTNKGNSGNNGSGGNGGNGTGAGGTIPVGGGANGSGNQGTTGNSGNGSNGANAGGSGAAGGAQGSGNQGNFGDSAGNTNGGNTGNATGSGAAGGTQGSGNQGNSANGGNNGNGGSGANGTQGNGGNGANGTNAGGITGTQGNGGNSHNNGNSGSTSSNPSGTKFEDPLQSDKDIDHSKDYLGTLGSRDPEKPGKYKPRTNKWDCGNGYTAYDTDGDGKADIWVKEYKDENGNTVQIIQEDTDHDGTADKVQTRTVNDNPGNNQGKPSGTGAGAGPTGPSAGTGAGNGGGTGAGTGTQGTGSGSGTSDKDEYNNHGYNKDGYNKKGEYNPNYNTNLTDAQKKVVNDYRSGKYSGSNGRFDAERFYNDMKNAGFGDDVACFDDDKVQDIWNKLKNCKTKDDLSKLFDELGGAGNHIGGSGNHGKATATSDDIHHIGDNPYAGSGLSDATANRLQGMTESLKGNTYGQDRYKNYLS